MYDCLVANIAWAIKKFIKCFQNNLQVKGLKLHIAKWLYCIGMAICLLTGVPPAKTTEEGTLVPIITTRSQKLSLAKGMYHVVV